MTDQKDLYRSVDTDFVRLPGREVVAWSTDRDLFQVYPPEAAEVLPGCNEFRTLEAHAKEWIRKRQLRSFTQPGRSPVKKLQNYLAAKLIGSGVELPVPARKMREVQRRLELLVIDGFLISKHELGNHVSEKIAAVKPATASDTAIHTLGIPTRNRREGLLDCLNCFLKAARGHDRPLACHIMDDSDAAGRSNRTRQAVQQLCEQYNSAVVWMNGADRQALADRIAKECGAPAEIVAFALLGDPQCEIRTGASRNTLLLLAAGEPSLQADDDILCRTIPAPWKENGIALVSNAECCRYRYYQAHDSPDVNLKIDRDTDFFALHETLLGKHPAEVIGAEPVVDIDRLGGRLLDKLGDPEARVAATFPGVYGDSGMYRHWQRLCLEGESFHSLTGNETTYRDYLCTRQLLRAPARTTIGDSPFCMAGVTGLDTTRLLPPFMTVQRNQDGVFGHLLYLTVNQALRGYLPWAVGHNPPERTTRVDLSFALSVGPLRVSDILIAVLLALQRWPMGRQPGQNLQLTGRYLHEMSELPASRFKVSVREACWQVIRSQMGHLQRCLDERFDAPEYWQADVKQVLANFQELMLQEDLCIPSDLPGSASERLELFRELVGKFGQVLIHWPAMWDAAVGLNTERRGHKLEANL